jgi:hypothetical protein
LLLLLALQRGKGLCRQVRCRPATRHPETAAGAAMH